ncbi:MAG: AarF/UbiB family protein [bacterium]|nr:AarF/UbiB family protein [bacterium]
MQDLKSPRSASALAPTEADLNGNGTGAADASPLTPPPASSTTTNGYRNGSANESRALVPVKPTLSVDPVAEPAFLDNADLVTEPKPDYIPSPDESTVASNPRRSRSLRMQWRFWRTIVFAGVLFLRLIFWQVYFRKVAPEWVDRTNTNRWKGYAREFRGFAGELGGVFIKLGQFISTRYDILPEEILKELEGLQDEVPTIRFNKIRAVLERELGPIRQRYASFNEQPIAAASLGQAHKATLLNGDKVVVKVQRPGIREICYTDLAAMRVVARIAMRFSFISRRCDAVALVDEFGAVLLQELSYKHEAYNAYRFAQMFKDDMGVYIPTTYNEHSTDQVLTIEDVTSIKINDFEAMERAGISRKAVAKRMMDTYLEQVFDHYFFHADPHPGNLFVYPLPLEPGQKIGPEGRPFYLIFIDFGMTGTLTREIAEGMVSTLNAVLTRDYKTLIRGYQELGFLLPGADISRIEEAAKAAFDQVWGMSMTDMRTMDFDSVADLADEFSDLIFSMPFYIPQDFIYLGRTISILSGMATSLDPHFNAWTELMPYTEKLIAKGFGVEKMPALPGAAGLGLPILQSLFSGNGAQVLRNVADEVVRRTISPVTAPVTRVDSVIQQLEKGELRIIAEPSLTHRAQLKRLEKESRKTQRSVVFGSLLVASAILFTGGYATLGAIGFAVALAMMLVGFLRD